MTLTFTQENGLYVAEFEATAPFSIHLERPKGGFINMLQRSVDSGTFVAVKNFNPNYNATQVIDADCGQGAVYPKWIRLESAVEPSIAEVTFESESSGGGAGESTMEYLDVSELDVANKNSKYAVLGAYSSSIKAKAMGYIAFVPSGVYDSIAAVSDTAILAVAIDFNLPTNAFGQTLMTAKEYILSLPGDSSFTEEELAAIPRITKEQFYNLEA